MYNNLTKFPVEFNYSNEYKVYKYIGNSRYKDNSWYCMNYSAWKNHIKAAYNTVNTNDDKAQLLWALRDHKKDVSFWKEALITIVLTILILIAPVFIKMLSITFPFLESSPQKYTIEKILSEDINNQQTEVSNIPNNTIRQIEYVINETDTSVSLQIEFYATFLLAIILDLTMALFYGHATALYIFDEEALRILDTKKEAD